MMKHVHFLSIRPIAAKYPHCWQTRDVTCIALAVRPSCETFRGSSDRPEATVANAGEWACRHLRNVSKTSNAVARRDDAQIDTHRGAANFDCASGRRGSRRADVRQEYFTQLRKQEARRAAGLPVAVRFAYVALRRRRLSIKSRRLASSYSLLTGVLDVATTCHLPPFRDHTCRLWCGSSPFVPCVMTAVSALRNVTL